MSVNDLKDEYLEECIQAVMKQANNKESEAAHMGAFGDGGANRLRDQVKYFQLGMQGKVPDEWKQLHKKWFKEKDPRYQQYLELKKEFGE